MRRRTSPAEEGFSLLEVLLGIAIFAMLAGSFLFAATSYGKSLRQSAAVEAATTSATTLVDSVERDARSATAIFTPAVDVANNSNADGHELDFYTRSAAGSGTFQAYCFKAGASTCGSAQRNGSLGLYRYAWSALPQNSGAGATYAGSVADNMMAFSSKTVAASVLLDSAQNPTTAAYFSKIGVTSANDVARQTGYPGVLAGNRVTIVTIANSVATRSIHLLAGAQPTRRQIVVATYTPPPNAMAVNGSNAANITFANPLAAAQSVNLTEPNYGTRATSPAQVYNVIGSSCSNVANYNPNPTITPAGDGTGQATVSLQPVVHAAPGGESCSVVVADNSNQTVTINVAVGQTYAPSSSGPVSGRPGQWGAFILREQNYPGPAFTIASLSGPCSNQTNAGTSQSGGVFSEQVNLQFTGPGTCTLTAQDAYGQTTSASVAVYADAQYTIVLGAPSPSSVAAGGTFTFTASATLSNGSDVAPGTPASIPVGPTNYNPCDPNPKGWQPSWTTFTVTTQSSNCTVEISANASGVPNATVTNNPQYITEAVYTSAQYTLATSGVPGSLNNGQIANFNATATLQNPGSAPPGTPSTIPVGITGTSGPCSAGPAGWQPSGSTFSVTGSGSGNCALQIGSNDSQVLNYAIPVYAAAAYTLQISGPGTKTLTQGGSSTTFAASAPLTNAAAAPPGSPGSLSVGVTNVTGQCSASPSGWQNSGSTFTVTPSGATSGTCSVTVGSNGAASGSPTTLTFTVNATSHVAVNDQCGYPTTTLVFTDNSTTPPTDHYGTGAPCASPTPTPTPAPGPPTDPNMCQSLVAYVKANDFPATPATVNGYVYDMSNYFYQLLPAGGGVYNETTQWDFTPQGYAYGPPNSVTVTKVYTSPPADQTRVSCTPVP